MTFICALILKCFVCCGAERSILLREEQLLCGTLVARPLYWQKRQRDLISLIHGTRSYSCQPSHFWPDGQWLRLLAAPWKWIQVKDKTSKTFYFTKRCSYSTMEVHPTLVFSQQTPNTFVGMLDNFTLSVCLCASVFLSTHLFAVYSLIHPPCKNL